MSYFFDSKFFTGRNDPKVVEAVIGTSLYWWLRIEAQKSVPAVLDLTTPTTSTLTFPVAIDGVAISDLVGGLVILTNNNGVGRYFDIDANTTTVLTFDVTLSKCESDETSNFTSTGTYNVKIWSPERFFGFTSDATLGGQPEYKYFVEGVPESRKARALVRRFPIMTMNVRTTDDSYDEAVHSMVDTNPAAPLSSHLRVGSSSEVVSNYFFHGRDQFDIGAKEREIVLFNTKLSSNGDDIKESGPDDWVIKPLMIDMFTEENCGIDENYYEARRKKAS